MRSTSFFANVCLIAGALGQGPAPVTIDAGEIVGSFLPSGVRAWVGVPFAKSPPERFSPPEDPVPWKTPLTVTKAKPSCIQQFNSKIYQYSMTSIKC
jgi:carboxylesterase 2